MSKLRFSAEAAEAADAFGAWLDALSEAQRELVAEFPALYFAAAMAGALSRGRIPSRFFERVVMAAGADAEAAAAALTDACRTLAERTHVDPALPELPETPLAMPLDDTFFERCPDLETVYANAALHVFGAQRKSGLIDSCDVAIALLDRLEVMSARSELAAKLKAANFTALAFKLADAGVHAEGGPADGLVASGDAFEELLSRFEENGDGEEEEEPEDITEDAGDKGEAPAAEAKPADGKAAPAEAKASDAGKKDGASSDEKAQERAAQTADAIAADLRKAFENFSNGPIAEMIREMAEKGEPVRGTVVVDGNGRVVGVSAGVPGEGRSGGSGDGEDSDGDEAEAAGREASSRSERFLSEHLDELTAKAAKGQIEPIVGRSEELARIAEILCRKTKNKPLVIGESGTGKTALVEGLAAQIAAGTAPASLKGARIWALDGSMLSSRYKGVFGERLAQIADAVKKVPNSILFIDDIHSLVDGNDAGSLEQMNALQRLVSDPDLRLIATTSFKPWRSVFSQNAAIVRRFQTVELKAVGEEDAKAIMRAVAPQLERFHHVHFKDGVSDRAVTLSSRFILDRALPDKAIDVLDETAAAARVKRPAGDDEVIEIGAEALVPVIARMAHVPAEQVGSEEGEDLARLPAAMKSAVFGQDAAIDALVSAVKLSRAGLGSSERPVGSFLFMGPTGVGKTEAARQLAKAMKMPLLRFDMSEYSEAFTVSRLIGAPAGYVGYNEGGLLTEQVTKNPYSVVLLDEIEKAHPRLFDLLLQVMDRGRLTDASGREADFRNVILIMTSNVGARSAEKNAIGFGNEAESGSLAEDRALQQTFSPEFRNRLDAIVRFAPLSHEALAAVVNKFLNELSEQLRARGVTAVYTDAFRAWLAERGYDPHMGARPMRRLIADRVRKPLADELLFGALAHGGTVTADVRDGKPDAQGRSEKEPFFTFGEKRHD
jgi:ATP-dependent Clp protease ATP-binding subunit ClpA